MITIFSEHEFIYAQLIFIQSAIDKMNDNNGRAAIIENGSPLFTGGTASGELQIRRWLLENDLIEAIVQMPTDLRPAMPNHRLLQYEARHNRLSGLEGVYVGIRCYLESWLEKRKPL